MKERKKVYLDLGNCKMFRGRVLQSQLLRWDETRLSDDWMVSEESGLHSKEKNHEVSWKYVVMD